MIIVQLIGGLGNQLFQYALGKELAFRRNTKLFLDLSAFRTYKRHACTLSHFNITEPTATQFQILNLKLRNVFNNSELYYKKNIIKESAASFDPNILNADPDTYLIGYWQSEKYFSGVRDIIRTEITLREPQDEKYLSNLKEIAESNSVSIHIRRTDYLSKKSSTTFQACTPDYYKNALAVMKNKISDHRLFVFSDDIAWVKNNLELPSSAKYISDREGFANYNYQELMLMSACKHNITANSTFSWWGAWLNNNLDKIIIAPQKWFVNKALDDKDLIPPSWIRL